MKKYLYMIILSVKDNFIHHNRRAVFVVNSNPLDNIVVDRNIILNNVGKPIHYEDYDDYKIENHPKDWEYNKRSELMILKNNDQKKQFSILDIVPIDTTKIGIKDRVVK